ncbi:MAG: hypothetical protein HUU55_15915 [Myxococcales bacterium]|nr:hypothetical protein [Myxococcales bacterium]
MTNLTQLYVHRYYFNAGIWLFCAIAIAGGCSDSGGGDPSGASADIASGVGPDVPSFGEDSDQADSAVKDGALGGGGPDLLTPIPHCQSDSECADGLTCDCYQKCVPKGDLICAENKNCGSGAFCDTCTGYCKPLKMPCELCNDDVECQGTGSICYDLASGGRVCGLACLSDIGCPAGYACIDVAGVKSKQCVPKSGSCAQPGECTEDKQCPFPLVCNDSQQVCAAGCPDDDSCAGDLVCQGGHCVQPCDDATNPCENGQQCNAGHCFVPGGCVSGLDCPDKETYCDPTSSKCVSGCLVDFDCKQTSKACVDGRCVDKPCPGNYYCAFGEVCSATTGKCEDAVGPYCATCDQQNDTVCKSPGTQNLCVGFQNEDGVDVGDFCLVQCGPDFDNPCPQGYACKEIEVQEGDKRNVCFRNCSVPPVGTP